MISPPVHRPDDPAHDERVGWGLALASAGVLVPLALSGAGSTPDSPASCGLRDCPVAFDWVAYLVTVAVLAGATGLWWLGHRGRRMVLVAEVCGLFALGGWWFVRPLVWGGAGFLHPVAGLVPGGLLVAAGTGGLLRSGGRDTTTDGAETHGATALTSGLARAGGTLALGTGAVAALLVAESPVLAAACLGLLSVYLLVCVRPVTWIRSHLLVFVAVAGRAGPGHESRVTPADRYRPQDRSPATLAVTNVIAASSEYARTPPTPPKTAG
jgi:hypothetical protein